MGTILGKGFAQVHTNHSTSAEGTSAVMYARVGTILCKNLSQDCPHGEVAFSNSDINKKKMQDKNLSNCLIHFYYV